MINGKTDYPVDCTEYRIHQVLAPLVKEMKEQIFTDDFKKSDEFKSEKTELETLGIIISKYCEWDGDRIEQVSLAAFEDSNYQATIEY